MSGRKRKSRLVIKNFSNKVSKEEILIKVLRLFIDLQKRRFKE